MLVGGVLLCCIISHHAASALPLEVSGGAPAAPKAAAARPLLRTSLQKAVKDTITPNNAALVLTIATVGSFYKIKTSATISPVEKSKNYVLGLLIACVALVGNAIVSALRKVLSTYDVGSAQQVGLACLIQGVFAIIYCVRNGVLDLGPQFVEKLPAKAFWYAAVGASIMNSVVKILETKAFAEADMSLCAPFLAFDPVMQFVVGVFLMPAACRMIGLGCDDVNASYPPYHITSVCLIALGAFMLGGAGGGKGQVSSFTGKEVTYLGPLPVGSWYILLNCVIYSFTSRCDKLAIKNAGKTLYYAYGRLLMAATTLGGAFSTGGLNKEALMKFANPKVAGLILGVCVADAVYMLSLYQAFSWISPVYVTAVKRGGGILLASLLGVLFFGESLAGRLQPILTICIGVTFLCL